MKGGCGLLRHCKSRKRNWGVSGNLIGIRGISNCLKIHDNGGTEHEEVNRKEASGRDRQRIDDPWYPCVRILSGRRDTVGCDRGGGIR